MVFLYPFFDGYLNSFLYGIGYLCERMISLRGDMSAENNEKHQNNEIYMVRMLLLVVVCIGLLPIQMRAQKNSYIIPGEVWKDTDGNPINAHGGGLLYHDGTYYWYGEYKKGKTILPDWATWECYRTDVTGVGCYSSKDLLNWKFEGHCASGSQRGPEP